jgi:hypothetical protein
VGAILHQTRLHQTRLRLSVVLVALLVSSTAGAQRAIPDSSSVFRGRVVDATFLPVSGVTLNIEDRGRRTTRIARTDSLGLFEAQDMPAGEYEVEVVVPGFEAVRQPVLLVGPVVERELVLTPGRLSETITVDGGSASRAVVRRDNAATSDCVPRMDATTQSPVGGQLSPPRMLSREAPEFPAHLNDAQVDGDVQFEGRIGVDGSINQLDVVASTHPDFAAAAEAAVRQWTWESPLLNCVPVEVDISLDIRFRAAR